MDEQMTVWLLQAAAIEAKTFFLRSGISGTHSWTWMAFSQASASLSVPLIRANCSLAFRLPLRRPDFVRASSWVSLKTKIPSLSNPNLHIFQSSIDLFFFDIKQHHWIPCRCENHGLSYHNTLNAFLKPTHDRPIRPDPTIPTFSIFILTHR